MIIEVEQISLGTVEVEVVGGDLPAFEIYAGNPLATEVVLLEVGPVGPMGPQGPAVELGSVSVGQLNDVAITSPANGDTLIFSSGKFRNRPGTDLVDGGNF